jgi:hypothetical protein
MRAVVSVDHYHAAIQGLASMRLGSQTASQKNAEATQLDPIATVKSRRDSDVRHVSQRDEESHPGRAPE